MAGAVVDRQTDGWRLLNSASIFAAHILDTWVAPGASAGIAFAIGYRWGTDDGTELDLPG